jgi:hypothetical protein
MRLPPRMAAYSRGVRGAAISGGYAVLVLGVTVFVFIANRRPPTFAAMWLFLPTLPISLPIQFLQLQGSLYILSMTLGGLLQAWLLWLALRGKRVNLSPGPPRSS